MVAGRVHLETLAWAAVAIVAWAISAHFNVSNIVIGFAQRHEDLQLDELLTLIMFLGAAAFIASFLQSRRHLRFRRAAEREAFAAARLDVLTCLPNRRMFLELAGTALGEAWNSGSKCSVLFIDLDGFKPVNDTLGHATGDALLIAVGKRLGECAPENALVARLGGDEFAILLPNTEHDESALFAARRVLAGLQRAFDVAGQAITVNASIGVATGPDNGKRAEDLTDAADRAMYEAKRAGRGTIRVFKPESFASYQGDGSPRPAAGNIPFRHNASSLAH